MRSSMEGVFYLDYNAAGHGWFVDPTPYEHGEFSTVIEDGLRAEVVPSQEDWNFGTNTNIAAESIDLLTALAHAFGRRMSIPISETGVTRFTLEPGVRRLPSAEEIDLALSWYG